MTATTSSPLSGRRARTPAAGHGRSGAPLWPPVVAYAVLTVLAVAVPPLIAGVRPWSSDAALLDFFAHHAGAAHAGAFFTVGSAVPLAVLTAVATSRLRHLGIDVPGRVIAQVGGAVAVAMLALAGVATLAGTQDRVADSPAAIRALNGITYAAGGPAFVMFSGLLVAGIAISGLAGGVLPRAVGWSGVGVAVVSEVASLANAFDAMSALLPVGRFGTLVWLVALAGTLPAHREVS